MLHYNTRHVSSSTMLIFGRSNCFITASGIVTLCKRPYGMPVEIPLSSSLNWRRLQYVLSVTFPLQMTIQLRLTVFKQRG